MLALPEKYRKRLRTTNMLERFPRKLSGVDGFRGRSRERVIRIFPNMDSSRQLSRIAGALCAETHEDGNLGFPRSTGRRYLTMDEYFEWRADESDEEALGEGASLNGEPAVQSDTVPA